jgi:hypothetical protein
LIFSIDSYAIIFAPLHLRHWWHWCHFIFWTFIELLWWQAYWD